MMQHSAKCRTLVKLLEDIFLCLAPSVRPFSLNGNASLISQRPLLEDILHLYLEEA